MAVLTSDDRRTVPRRAIHEIPHVAGVRVSSETVEVINASSRGLLVEGGFPMRPGTSSYVDIIEAAGTSVRVNGSVVRCQIAALGPNKPRYRVAIAFDRAVPLIDAGAPPAPAAPEPPAAQADSGFVVVDAQANLDPACSLNNW